MKIWRRFKRNFKNIVLLILLLGFIFGIFLAGFEGALRYMNLNCAIVGEDGNGIYDFEDGFSLKKNFKGTFKCLEFDTSINTNSDGFRDDEFVRDNVVMVLGDSWVFSHGVDIEESFVQLLEGYNFHNFGVPGYGPKEYIKVLEENIEKFDVKLIIVTLYEGDDVQESCGLIDRNEFVRDEREGGGKLRSILKKSYTVRILEPLLKNVVDISESFATSKLFYLEEESDIVKECNLELKKDMARIKDLSGDKLMFLVLPSKKVFEGYTKKMETILNFCSELNVRCLKVEVSEEFYLREGHFNVEGHKALAKLIQNSL
jgi:hypothetical protein